MLGLQGIVVKCTAAIFFPKLDWQRIKIDSIKKKTKKTRLIQQEWPSYALVTFFRSYLPYTKNKHPTSPVFFESGKS